MNIKKIAEEIFQAPNEDELFERALEASTKIRAIGIIDQKRELTSDEFLELKRMFPKGVFYLGWHSSGIMPLEDYIKKYAKNKKLWITTGKSSEIMDWSKSWFTMKVKNRNVLQLSSQGISAYYIEII